MKITLTVCFVLLLAAVALALKLRKVSARADRLWKLCRQNEAAEFERVIGGGQK